MINLFKQICPEELFLAARNSGIKGTRFSVNLIQKGLNWHVDMAQPKQPDCKLTVPSITFAIHLGADPTDVVTLELEHDKSEYDLLPGMMYAFPGYALSHRTTIKTPLRARRYSLVISFIFQHNESRRLDELIHSWYYECTDDSYIARYAYFDHVGEKWYTAVDKSETHGDCFYTAMSDQLRCLDRDIVPAKALYRLSLRRQLTWKHIRRVNRPHNTIINMLRRDKFTYAEHRDIQALAEVLEINIRVIQVMQKCGERQWHAAGTPKCHSPEACPTARIILYYKSEFSQANHYASLHEV